MDKISAAVCINNMTENNKKVLHLNFCTLSLEICNAVIRLHAVSGKDYVSVFFLKGKKLFWSVEYKNVKLMFGLSSL